MCLHICRSYLIALLLVIGIMPEDTRAQNHLSLQFDGLYTYYPDGSAIPWDPIELGDSEQFLGHPAIGQSYASGTETVVRTLFHNPNKVWVLDFDAPNGQILGPGTYLNAFHFPNSGDLVPSLRVRGTDVLCSYPQGYFTVHEASYTGGLINRLHISFHEECCWETTCDPDHWLHHLWGDPPTIDGEISYSACASADLNDDHQVNISDLSLMLSAFGSNGIHPYSINDAFGVDVGDLSVLLSQFGSTCEPFSPAP